MLVLDTDHMSLLQHADSPEGSRLRERLTLVPAESVVTTIVTFEEEVRGWLAAIAAARRAADVPRAYQRLLRVLLNYQGMTVLPFDEVAAAEFDLLRGRRLRVATMDLRIAAITLTHGATLLTRNTTDFAKVPGLKVDDWLR